jgi:hypothetical protein
MTEHDTKLFQNLPDVGLSSRMDYIPLGLLFLCLFIFDTETGTQATLLFFLTLTAAFLIWFGNIRRSKAPGHEAELHKGWGEAVIPGGNVKAFDDGSIELQTAAGTRRFRSIAELVQFAARGPRPSASQAA